MLGTYTLSDHHQFMLKALNWLQQFEVCCILNSNGYYQKQSDPAKHQYYHSYDLIIAAEARQELTLKPPVFSRLQKFIKHHNSWLFGYLGFDLKNETEHLESHNEDHLHFPNAYFFEPEFLFLLKGKSIEIIADKRQPKFLLEEVMACTPIQRPETTKISQSIFQNRISKDKYLETVEHIRQHIIEGDVYEMNFCQEFYMENMQADPFQLYLNLCEISPNPFSAFCRIHDKFILSASMERFLKKEGSRLISQPIKGTIRRGTTDEEDRQLALQLLNDEKEKAENVMIVDLVRNDLSKSCRVGSVKVEDLFGIYPFPNVHQMISTIVGELREEVHPVAALCNAFPMGSMTGAPKLMAMKLIEKYENTRRGVFSGAIGYFSPSQDFDFNVVIRTLLYDAATQYLSLTVGSAITYDSVPEKEYEECLLKIEAIRQILEK
ncbi:MAG: anthranilate synthase component I family protein [Bacteroidia bacterium]